MEKLRWRKRGLGVENRGGEKDDWGWKIEVENEYIVKVEVRETLALEDSPCPGHAL